MRAVSIAAAAAAFIVPPPSPSSPPTRSEPPRLFAQAQDIDSSPLSVRIGMARGEGRYAVTTIPLEAYVARVLTAEALPDSPPAALEALAIAVRTYTLANLGHHAADGFDLCDETHCQVMRTATPPNERAAAATAGQVLLNRGRPASIYYSASCGGRTELPSEVWAGAENPPFLPSRPDDGCLGAPVWTAQLADRDLLRALRAAGFRGDRLRALRIVSRNTSGRVARLRLDGLEPSEVAGPDFRAIVGRALGWQHIKSTAFELKPEADGYRFNGHGSGHGVGMCVIGSARLAGNGESAVQILRRYYPGLTIAPRTAIVSAADGSTLGASSVAPSPSAPPAARTTAAAAGREVTIVLSDGDERDRPSITSLVIRARDELARTLDVDAPRVAVRFHSSPTSFEQATARRHFVLAAVVNGDIHLVPPATLRERGVLEQMIRRALVHVMADAALGERPLWVREGAAVYFAGGSSTRAERASRSPVVKPRLSCPTDADLARPSSADALAGRR